MTSTLLAKEVRQHGWSFILLCLLNLMGLALGLWLVTRSPAFGTKLNALQAQVWFLAISGMILGNRLVVAEYHAHTQLFLEALPVPRWRVFITKYGLGFAAVTIIALSTFGAVLAAAMRTEELTTRFVAILLTRYLLFTWLTYGFFFMAGFLGKFRWAYFGFIIIAIMGLNSLSDVEVFRSGPFKLVTGDFPLERNNWPTADLALTAGLIVTLFLVSWLLGSLQEGSIAGKLGERMSFREKVTVFVLLIGAIFTVTLVNTKQPKLPYDTPDASVGKSPAITVKVSPKSEAADRVAERLADDLGAMADFLGIEKLPPLFVTGRPDLDADRFEYGILPNADGVALRTHFTAENWRYVDFLEFAIGGVMYNHSDGHSGYEPAFWVIDGFCLYWAHRRAGEGKGSDPADFDGPRRGLWLRALYGTEDYAEPITRDEHLHRWFAWQLRSGHHITAGVGWSGLVSLREKVGEEKFRAFVADVLGPPTPKNALTTLRDIIHPPEKKLANRAGIILDEFLATWNGQLDRARKHLGDELSGIPRLGGSFEFVAQSEARRSFTGEYNFEAPDNSDDLSQAALLYGEPLDFRTRVAESDLKRYPLSLEPGSQTGSVYQDFSAGTRVSHTMSARHAALGCRIISGWILTDIR